MKKVFNTAIILLSFLFITSNAFSQKNHFSIEGGYFFGGPATGIANSLKQNGFGDRNSWSFTFPDLFGGGSGLYISGSQQYPKTYINNSAFRIRYELELKNSKSVEISFGKIHKSEVKGLDITSTGRKVINFNNKVSLLSSSYMLNNKKHSVGIGAGPVLAFYKLDVDGYTVKYISEYSSSTEDVHSSSHNYLQPGIAANAYWRFVNKKVFFMNLRSGFTLLAPAKTNEISNSEGAVIFPSIKVNHSFFDITIGAGIKF